ncbi:MAG: hypothetical protein IT317_18735 [Anaerolineales bacterium]|nr:hypothetical protein [Anaerolineales bacterium]
MSQTAPRAELNEMYPVGEKQPDRVRTVTGRRLSELTLERVLTGEITAADFAISADGLRWQAEIAERAGRPRLAANLRRGAELVGMPEAEVLALYEQLRPGRARRAADLRATAERLRGEYAAEAVAELFEEAAAAYERRGILSRQA